MMKYLPLFALLIAVKFATSSAAAERPNLVFIIADDCTYLDMGVYGGQAKTPALDKLASEGMQFSRCRSRPSCSKGDMGLTSTLRARDRPRKQSSEI